MKIPIDEMMQRLDTVIQKNAEARRAKENDDFSKFLKNLQIISIRIDDIRQLWPIVVKLYKAYPNFKRDMFLTDGFYHHVGFTNNGKYFGCEGGGCSGSSFYVKLDDGLFYSERSGCAMNADEFATEHCKDNDIRSKAERVANGLDDYIKRLMGAVMAGTASAI